MAWKVDGKIGYLATGQTEGNPQQDTYRILYQAPGQNTQTEIEKVYYLAPGGNPATDLQLVWHRYMARILLAGSQNVAIEYIPTEDITVNSIEIFTSQTTSATSGRIKIIHESGLFVGAIDGNGEDATTELYNLTGRPRTVSNVGVTLYAGKKYYIVFQDSTNETYYPTYFQNETGNYKVYANTTGASQITIYSDAALLKATIGDNENLNNSLRDAILNLNTNEKFLWGGYPQQEYNPTSPAMAQNAIYNRENLTGSYAGKKTTVAGISATSNGDYCLIDVNDTGFTNGAVYRKTGNLPSFTEFNFNDYSSLSASDKLALFVHKLNGKTLFVTSTIAWQYYVNVQGLDTLKSGYTSDIEVNNNVPVLRTTLPTAPVEKCFYYIDGNAWTVWHATGLYVYENSNYTYVSSDADGFKTSYLVISQLTDYFTVINFSTIISFVAQPSYDYTFAHTTLSTDKKFYLKINGKEV